MCILLYEPACCLYEIPSGCLRGAGHAVLPAAATLLGTCAFRIVWICAVFPRQPSLALLYRAFPLSWLVTTALVALCFIIAAARRAAVPDRCAQARRFYKINTFRFIPCLFQTCAAW